eukprot:Nitzschia sp. Nitz4//scaffold133_size116822//74277//77815//NITZ4_003812-RA/size116822-snap-gene-0.17-mRNA-1//-1//CDS//3329535411//1332//frame0
MVPQDSPPVLSGRKRPEQGMGLEEGLSAPNDDGTIPTRSPRKKARHSVESTVSVPCSPMAKKPKGIQPPECGIITSIYVENFMCHRKLHVDLCRNVNFISGQNGSGKSAILAAIQICLGAGARRTHRAKNLKDLIRADSDVGYAKARVTLLNKGEDSYRHDLYGDFITVERTIAAKSGFNGYKLYDANMQEKSRSKKDLDDFLDKVNVQVENPVAILDQEEAKKFLTGKAEDKYNFFMKATELERIDRTIATTMDKLHDLVQQEKRLEDTLQTHVDLVDETKKQYDQHREIEKMRRKLYACQEAFGWATYQEANAVLMEDLERLEKVRERAKEKEEELTQAELASQETDTEELMKKKRLEDLNKEADDQSNLKHTLEKELKLVLEPLRSMERNVKHLEQEKANAARTLANATRRLKEKRQEILQRAGSAESDAARRTKMLQDLEDQMRDAKLKYDETKQAASDARRLYDEVEPSCDQARRNVSDAERKLYAVQNKVSNLENSSAGTSLNVFGPRCASVKKEIDNQARRGSFRGPVAGPIGSFVKIVPGKEKFAELAELALGNGSLDRFVVTNDHDRKVVLSIRKKLGCQSDCGVYQVSPHGRYNIPPPPVDGVETVASVLNISDDLVFNCLVDNCKIEEKALSASKDEAESKLLMHAGGSYSIRGKVKIVYFLPKGDNWTVRDGNLNMVSNDRRFRKTIGVDRTAALEDARREAETVKEELRVLKQEAHGLEEEHHRHQKAWNISKKALVPLQRQLNDLAQNIDRVKAEEASAENFDTDTSELEQDVAEAGEEIARIEEREKAIRDSITEKEPGIVEARRRLDEATARTTRVMEDIQQASRELTEHMRTMSQRTDKLEKRRKKVEHYHEVIKAEEVKVVEAKEEVKKYLKQARRLAYARLQREARDQQQNGDGVDDSAQLTQEPSDEDLEAVEISEVNNDSNYYRARVERLSRKVEEERERRNASKEDALAAYEKWVRAKQQLDGKMAQVKEVKTIKRHLTADVRSRKQRWVNFRQHIAHKTSIGFDETLNLKGSSGTVEFDHTNGSLDLVVQKDSADSNSQQKDVKALSGGERSFATIALLLALGESLETPFRILDEFDVFLDTFSRKLAIESLIEMGKSMSHRQFVFITPQDVSNVEANPMLKVLRLTPPNPQ